MSDTNALIQVKQLPIIEERLLTLKERWDKRAIDAESMVCTEDTIQAVKAFRAEMRKEFDEVESLRKQVKDAVYGPYNFFEEIYKNCVTNAFFKADAACAKKIHSVDDEIKQRCENGLREYFDELCAAHGIDWLKYEQAGINIDMASAKQKVPKKLREQLVVFVVNVAKDIETIDGLENAEEILAEYKLTLNFPDAFRIVQDRHQRIDAEAQAKADRQAAREAQAEAVRKVDALAPPTVQGAKTVTFTVTDTVDRLIALREWMKENGYEYR